MTEDIEDISEQSLVNPTEAIDLNFTNYLRVRRDVQDLHMIKGVPDYSFGLDARLRQQIASVGAVRSIAQLMVSTEVPLQKQLFLMHGVAVSPRSAPHIYKIGEECARLLGIGIPQIFLLPDTTPNAFTFATDNAAPMIVLTTSLASGFSHEELKFVIGHECGHIHNLHGVYNSAVILLFNPTARTVFHQMLSLGAPIGIVRALATAIQGALRLFLLSWSRCAEVTSDRAGLICCGDLEVAQSALLRLMIAGTENLQIDLEDYVSQIDRIAGPLNWLELTQTHPLIQRRIRALRVFAECEVLYSWRSELTPPAHGLSKTETDRRCEQILEVAKV